MNKDANTTRSIFLTITGTYIVHSFQSLKCKYNLLINKYINEIAIELHNAVNYDILNIE